MELKKINNINHFEKLFKKKVSKGKYDWAQSGSGNEQTIEANLNYLKNLELKSRICIDVSNIDITQSFFGKKFNSPLIVAPMGHLTQYHKHGEGELAKGAEMSDTIFVLSGMSRLKPSEVRKMSKNAKIIYQIFIHGDIDWIKNEIDQALKINSFALCITCDSPVRAINYVNNSNNFDARKYGKNSRKAVSNQYFSSTFTWKKFNEIVKYAKLPVIIKGVMSDEDMKLSIDNGADAIWVSNHGGRKLDSGKSSIQFLRDSKFKGIIPIIADGGIRNGSDILKTLAIGADMISLGRPFLYGLSVDGKNGVNHIINLLLNELKTSMAFCGLNKIKKINQKIIY